VNGTHRASLSSFFHSLSRGKKCWYCKMQQLAAAASSLVRRASAAASPHLLLACAFASGGGERRPSWCWCWSPPARSPSRRPPPPMSSTEQMHGSLSPPPTHPGRRGGLWGKVLVQRPDSRPGGQGLRPNRPAGAYSFFYPLAAMGSLLVYLS
jgi:hypothetical protein